MSVTVSVDEEPRRALTIQEFAATLGVSASLVRRQIEAGHLNASKFGGRVLIPISELDRVLDGSRD